MTKEFKMENLEENLLLDLHTKYPNTIDDNARLFVGTLGFEKGKAHGCIYSGKAQIINKAKGIRLDLGIWLDVFCEAYSTPEIEPNIDTYLTGKYATLQKIRLPAPKLDLKAVILLNVPEPENVFKAKHIEQRYFDTYWHVFDTTKGNYVLSKEGWFGTWLYDEKLGMRPANDNDWIDLGDEKRQLKPGLEIVTSFELNKDPKKDFLREKYYEKINPDMYVEL
jgi:hypothetical protein